MRQATFELFATSEIGRDELGAGQDAYHSCILGLGEAT